jgi:hypothetical protein
MGGDSDLLARTRNGVLNVLMLVGGMIAVSGVLLRGRAEDPAAARELWLRPVFLGGLFGVGCASYLVRRAWWRRPEGMPLERCEWWFYWTHIGSVAIVAGGVPLGLGYGWWVEPALQAIAPFWVVPLALGFLAIPRRGELEELPPIAENERDEGPPS